MRRLELAAKLLVRSVTIADLAYTTASRDSVEDTTHISSLPFPRSFPYASTVGKPAMPQCFPTACSSTASSSSSSCCARSNVARPLVMRLGRKRPAAAASLRIDLDDQSVAAVADSLQRQENLSNPLVPHQVLDASSYSSSSAESSPIAATGVTFGAEEAPDAKRIREESPLTATLSDGPSRGCLTPITSPKTEPAFLPRNAPGALQRLGPYEFVGASSGSVRHAVDIRNKSIKVCQALQQPQYDHLLRVTARLNAAESLWKYGDAEELREAVLPRAVDVATDKDGQRYLFTPATYGSLHGFVQGRKQRLTENDTRDLYRQIVRLIAFCHRLGIVVRDLKLRKFVFADRAQTKLRLNGVFDLVVCADVHDDRMKDRHGCPAYVSPEILDMAGASYSGKAADIWSLGVLLFVLLIGRYPFYDSTPQGLFGRIRAGQFAIPADATVSYPARALIHGLLRRDPTERPSAEALLALPWLAAKDSTVSAASVVVVQTARGRKGVVLTNNAQDQLVPSVDLDQLYNQPPPPPSSSPNPTVD